MTAKGEAGRGYLVGRRPKGRLRRPASGRLLYRKAGTGWWEPVNRDDFGTKLDLFHTVVFDPVETTRRIEAQFQPKRSAGILLWRVSALAK